MINIKLQILKVGQKLRKYTDERGFLHSGLETGLRLEIPKF